MQIDRPISIAITLFVTFLLVFFLVVPEYNTFVGLQSDLGNKTAEFKAQHEYYTAMDKVYDQLQTRQSDVQKINDALPLNPNLGQIIYFLQLTAKENGLIIQSLSLSKVANQLNSRGVTDNIKDIVFSVDLMGGYKSLEGFMVALEKSTRIFEITNISFGVQAGSPEARLQASQNSSFKLQIKTHSY